MISESAKFNDNHVLDHTFIVSYVHSCTASCKEIGLTRRSTNKKCFGFFNELIVDDDDIKAELLLTKIVESEGFSCCNVVDTTYYECYKGKKCDTSLQHDNVQVSMIQQANRPCHIAIVR